MESVSTSMKRKANEVLLHDIRYEAKKAQYEVEIEVVS